MKILALETSCDDTCASVVEEGAIRSNTISSQRAHDRFGGVVPEIASRHHLEIVNVVVEQALADAGADLGEIDLVAATQGPGLIGALLVGLSTAKAIAAARELPFAAVDHIQGHVAANFLVPAHAGPGSVDEGAGEGDDEDGNDRDDNDGARGGGDRGEVVRFEGTRARAREKSPLTRARAGTNERNNPTPAPLEPPFLCLIASGGHTLLAEVREHDGFRTLGRTLDDAAGEAFDKGARMLGLGYPGGPALQRLAAEGDPDAFEFPASGSRTRGGRSATRPFAQGLDFSFAGLKTSLLYRVRELGEAERERRAADLAASYQAAIVDHLIMRAERALEQTGLQRLAVGGGVAANAELRRRLALLGAETHVPPIALCTDNAAMIASAARYVQPMPYPAYLGLDAYATGERPR